MTTQTTNFEGILEAFLLSKFFKEGVISSTKAGWGGSCYKAELLPDGTWNVLWENQIGNMYETPGVILSLPQLETSDMQQYLADRVGTEDDFLSEGFDLEEEDLKQEMRDALSDEMSTWEL